MAGGAAPADITESDVVRLLEFLAPRIASGARNEPAERLAAEVVAGYGPKRVREDGAIRPTARVPCLVGSIARLRLSQRDGAHPIVGAPPRLSQRRHAAPRGRRRWAAGGTPRHEGLDVILADDDVAEPLGFVDCRWEPSPS